METYYAVFSFDKYQSLSSLRMQERHNEREYPMNHIDENLTPFNKELVHWAGLPHYTDRWNEIVIRKEAELGHKLPMRSNSVRVVDIVTAFSPGAEKALDIDIDEWCEANLQFMKDTFGEENIIAMTLHCDEIDKTDDLGRRGIHIHTEIIPIDERGRLCAKSFFGGRMQVKAMHDKYAEYMAPFGLSRGENGSKMKHEDRRRWYTQVTKLCQMEAPKIRDGEQMEDFIARLNKEFQDLNMRLAAALEKADKKIAVSETRQSQIFQEYAYAINLQHILEEEFGGDMRLVNERLLAYQTIEKSVPRIALQETIEDVLRRNPPALSIATLRKGKKKKHAKWASLDENTILQTETSGSETAEDFVRQEESIADETTTAKRSQSLLTEEGRAAYEDRHRRDRDEREDEERDGKDTGKSGDSLSNSFGEKLEN